MTEQFVTPMERARTALTVDIRRKSWPKILHAWRLYRNMRTAFPQISEHRTMWMMCRQISKGHVNYFPNAVEVLLPRGSIYRITFGTTMLISRVR
jgi:hypothetical protein